MPSRDTWDHTAHLCTSINEDVVHGIPSMPRIAREGDILSIDFGIVRTASTGIRRLTFPVGAVKPGVSSRLLAVTERSLAAGIGEVRPGTGWAKFGGRTGNG